MDRMTDKAAASAEPLNATPKTAGAHSYRELPFRGYIPGLDVLRGFAVTAVITYHGVSGRVPANTVHGWQTVLIYISNFGFSGVQLFFMLSGFLITGILLDNVTRKDYYSRFYFNRVCRILPAYVLMLVVLKSLHIIQWPYVAACLLYIANMAKLVHADVREYPVFWSLAVEEQFYLLWPTVLRRIAPRKLVLPIALYFIVGFLLRVQDAARVSTNGLYYRLWGQADWLFAGALVAITVRTGQLHADNIGKWIRGLWVACTVMLVNMLLTDTGHTAPGRWPGALQHALTIYFFTTAYMAILLQVVATNRGKAGIAGRSLFTRWLAWMGYISYGLYLVHELVYHLIEVWFKDDWIDQFHNGGWPLLVNFLVSASIAIVIAFLSRRYFEEFFLKVKDHRARMKTRQSLSEAVASRSDH